MACKLVETSAGSYDGSEVDGFFSPQQPSRTPSGVFTPMSAPGTPLRAERPTPVSSEMAEREQPNISDVGTSVQEEVARLQQQVSGLADDVSSGLQQERAQLGLLSQKVDDHHDRINELSKQVAEKLENDRLAKWMWTSSLKEATTELREMILHQAATIERLKAQLHTGPARLEPRGAQLRDFWRWLSSSCTCCGPRRGLYESFEGDTDEEDAQLSTPLSCNYSMSRGHATPVLSAQQASERYIAGMSRFSISSLPKQEEEAADAALTQQL